MSSEEMCSFFYQSMETVQGDLTDIVRGGCGLPAGFLPLTDDVSAVEPIAKEFPELSAKGSSLLPRPINPAPAAPLVSAPQAPGVRRRKGQAKRVICIPAPAASDQESNKTSGVVVPPDLWAWRKYGQKPIKGSPYPRGYYRCSSSKGCSARKQVERSRGDPNMLVITYTSEHNHPWPTHRNSLAGSTRSSHNTSKNSINSPHNNQISPPSSSKQEADDMLLNSNSPLEAIEEENLKFEQVFDQSYELIMLEPCRDMGFFDELGELEPDPMGFFFSSKELMGNKLEEEGENKGLDPLSHFDCDGN